MLVSLSTSPVRERLSVALMLATWAAIQLLILSPGLALAFALVFAGAMVAVVSGPRS